MFTVSILKTIHVYWIAHFYFRMKNIRFKGLLLLGGSFPLSETC